MFPLPNDYARCMSPDGCPMAATCLRTVDTPPDAYRTILQDFPGGKNCPGYIPGVQSGKADATP